jgi:hypothetical protein
MFYLPAKRNYYINVTYITSPCLNSADGNLNVPSKMGRMEYTVLQGVFLFFILPLFNQADH